MLELVLVKERHQELKATDKITLHYVAATGAPLSPASPSSASPLPSKVVMGMLSLAVAAAVALVIGFASPRKKSG